MTIAEQLRREGEERGVQKGLVIGRDEGREELRIEVAVNMLKLNLRMEDIMKSTGLSKEELIKLQNETHRS